MTQESQKNEEFLQAAQGSEHERLKEVLAFVNNKGGVGKTTTTVCLASALLRERKDWRILVIDLDSQCNASMLLGWNDKSKGNTVYEALKDGASLPVYETSAKNYGKEGGVFLCPGHTYMSGIDTALRMQRPAEMVLRKLFAKPIEDNTDRGLPLDITEAFDYVLIDCPPALGDITYNALTVSDGVVIPVEPDRLSADALSKTICVYTDCQKNLNRELRFRGILLTRVDQRATVVREFIEYIRNTYDKAVFNTMIRLTAMLKEAQGIGKDLYEYNPYGNTGMDYTSFAKEILETYSDVYGEK